MAVQFGAQILDTLLAPGISSFMEAEVPNLSGECPEADHWLSNFFLNSLLGPRYDDKWKQATITFIFRTQCALRGYNSAREKTLECADRFSPGRPVSRVYFEAISHWEMVVLNIQIALDLFLKIMDPNAPVTEDAIRIRRVANRIKHFAEDIKTGKNSPDLTLPMWLEKDRLKTREGFVIFEELAENLREMGKAADILQNPGYTPPSL